MNLPDGEVVELGVLPVELLADDEQPGLGVQLEGVRLRLQGVRHAAVGAGVGVCKGFQQGGAKTGRTIFYINNALERAPPEDSVQTLTLNSNFPL